MKVASFEVHAVPQDTSPWSLSERVGILLWSIVWPLLCGWTPKPLNAWRLSWLRIFGCTIYGKPFIHQRARIQVPWRLRLHHRACVGDRANLYSLGEIELGPGCVVAQEAYLCTGTHDFSDPNMALLTARIAIGANAFVGARAFIMPGVRVGDEAVVGACALVTENVAEKTVVAGSPARFLRFRESPVLEPN